MFATKFDSNFDFNTSLNRYKQREEYYQGYPKDNIPPLIIENSNDNLKDEKLFLDFLENSDIGLTLFEVNNTFDTFERATHNLITDNIDKENCN